MMTFADFGPRWWQYVTGLLCLLRPCVWRKETTVLTTDADGHPLLHSWWRCRRCGTWWDAHRRAGDEEPTPYRP